MQLLRCRAELADSRNSMKGPDQFDIQYGCHDSIFVNEYCRKF
jgi:hypothetical protein